MSTTAPHSKSPSWLEDAIFYEIYPQTFYDSNADGIGDLPGIISKLDYLASLGINALWLNPCFTSPFADAGYDVSDYYSVAPRYGTNDDLHRLFAEASQRRIRIFLDLVAGHTSIEHPWFKQSCQHQRNPYSDWFIWTSSAWTWDAPGLKIVAGYAERDGNYITNFFYSQPALNYGFANPDPGFPWQMSTSAPGPQAVRAEMKKIMKFWLDMGASGFRVDMAGSLVKHDPGQRATGQFWQEVRAWLDHEYPDAALVSEWSNPSIAIPAGFHMDFMIHFGSAGYTSLFRKPYAHPPLGDPYGFSFFDRAGHGNIGAFLDDYLPHYQKTRHLGYISLPTGNHDMYPRLAQDRDTAGLELAYLFLLTMPGVPYIYYGDEIGMRSIEGLPSKEGGYNRTGSRTPMQWDRSANAGFSQAPASHLYLPVHPDPNRPNVADQEQDPASLLNRVRRLIAMRKTHPSLRAGSNFEVLYAKPGQYPFVYLRRGSGETLLVGLNPSGQSVTIDLGSLPGQNAQVVFGDPGALAPQGEHWLLTLPAVSGVVFSLAQ